MCRYDGKKRVEKQCRLKNQCHVLCVLWLNIALNKGGLWGLPDEVWRSSCALPLLIRRSLPRRVFPLLSQNRQFQWFTRPTYIYPVVPALAATQVKRAGHEVAWLDGIASEWSVTEFEERLAAFKPDIVMLETKTPVVSAHWAYIRGLKAKCPDVIVVLGGRPCDCFAGREFQPVPG